MHNSFLAPHQTLRRPFPLRGAARGGLSGTAPPLPAGSLRPRQRSCSAAGPPWRQSWSSGAAPAWPGWRQRRPCSCPRCSQTWQRCCRRSTGMWQPTQPSRRLCRRRHSTGGSSRLALPCAGLEAAGRQQRAAAVMAAALTQVQAPAPAAAAAGAPAGPAWCLQPTVCGCPTLCPRL